MMFFRLAQVQNINGSFFLHITIFLLNWWKLTGQKVLGTHKHQLFLPRIRHRFSPRGYKYFYVSDRLKFPGIFFITTALSPNLEDVCWYQYEWRNFYRQRKGTAADAVTQLFWQSWKKWQKILLVKPRTAKPQATQARCINYREFRYCFAYYERF